MSAGKSGTYAGSAEQGKSRMNSKHQQELEDLIDAEIEDTDLQEVSPITRWYKFVDDLTELHERQVSSWDNDTPYCNECSEEYPCDTIKILDAYIEDSG